ncbi:MAG: alkaline shock response membrane anchor protein AmaP [Rikenellaceae bacterium]|nr:alkaline shock response membrane anchor protein AmaP [Rikenellaceae bacterium]
MNTKKNFILFILSIVVLSLGLIIILGISKSYRMMFSSIIFSILAYSSVWYFGHKSKKDKPIGAWFPYNFWGMIAFSSVMVIWYAYSNPPIMERIMIYRIFSTWFALNLVHVPFYIRYVAKRRKLKGFDRDEIFD